MIKLYNPTSGNVYYDGKDIFKYNHAEQKEFCKKVQMIFQNPYSSLNPRMTVKDIVGEGLKQHGMSTKDADAKVEQLLATVGLNKDHMSRWHLVKVLYESYTILLLQFLKQLHDSF